MKKWLPCFMMLVTLVVQAQSGTDSAREVVEGSLIGFVQAPVGKALPELFMAPDGKPDLIFLPKIANQQSADLRLAARKEQQFETFFGAKRFKAKLIAGINKQHNFVIQAIRLGNGDEWTLRGPETVLGSLDDRNLQVREFIIPAPKVDIPDIDCQFPDGMAIQYQWKDSGRTMSKFFVRGLPWKHYPCQAPQEPVGTISYWRRFTAETSGSVTSISDQRQGVFVSIIEVNSFVEGAGIKMTPFVYPRYVIHIDSRKQYPPVNMFRPDLMMLEASLLNSFQAQAIKFFTNKNSEYSSCLSVVVKQNKALPREQLINKMDEQCCHFPEFSVITENQFIENFVPKQWRYLWVR